jgi:hypothetical protein
MGRVCTGETGEGKRKGEAVGRGRAGLARKEERREEGKSCWMGRAANRERGEGRGAGWAGPKGEKRGKNNQMLLSLNMTSEFKFKSN